MLDSLRFVQGAVKNKDFVDHVPTHFEIKGGYVKGFNGDQGTVCPILTLTFTR